MSRKVLFEDGEYYHIYNRGVDKRIIFDREYDYIRFQMLLYLCNSTININFRDMFEIGNSIKTTFEIDLGNRIVNIGSYCLMSNHFHLILQQNIDGGISHFMQKLGTAYTMYFNSINDRNGSLFQGTFKAKHANTDEYLKYLVAYIHLNPIKIIDPKWKENGILNLKRAEVFLNEFPYSSYQDYMGISRPQNSIISKNCLPNYFDTKLEFKKLVSDWLKFRNSDDL